MPGHLLDVFVIGRTRLLTFLDRQMPNVVLAVRSLWDLAAYRNFFLNCRRISESRVILRHISLVRSRTQVATSLRNLTNIILKICFANVVLFQDLVDYAYALHCAYRDVMLYLYARNCYGCVLRFHTSRCNIFWRQCQLPWRH